MIKKIIYNIFVMYNSGIFNPFYMLIIAKFG